MIRVLFETKVQTEHKRYNLGLLQMEKKTESIIIL